MNINSPAEDKIIVELTEQDMLGLDITYDEMDYSTTETRRVIWTLLDEAGKALGRELDPSRRMIIEAIPKSEGGCVLNFTLLDTAKRINPQKQFLKKQSGCILCEFDNLDILYRAAENCVFSGESSLYESDGKYRLFLKSTDDIRNISRRFSEFGTVTECDGLTCEYTKEHWNLLAHKNAVSLLLNQ